MSTLDWGVLGFLLLIAASVGWLSIRHMMRRDQEPEEHKKWPEWWIEAEPPDMRGLRVPVAERIATAVHHIPWVPATLPGQVPSPAGA